MYIWKIWDFVKQQGRGQKTACARSCQKWLQNNSNKHNWFNSAFCIADQCFYFIFYEVLYFYIIIRLLIDEWTQMKRERAEHGWLIHASKITLHYLYLKVKHFEFIFNYSALAFSWLLFPKISFCCGGQYLPSNLLASTLCAKHIPAYILGDVSKICYTVAPNSK